jgi:hypothetical protein
LIPAAVALALAITACGSSGTTAVPAVPAGTVQGTVQLTTGDAMQIDLCSVSTYTAGTAVTAADVTWSGLVAHELTSAGLLAWEGTVSAPGFACSLNPSLRTRLDSRGGAFTIAGASPGRYALVVFVSAPRFTSGEDGRLVTGSDGEPVTAELTADRGVDVGTVKVEK